MYGRNGYWQYTQGNLVSFGARRYGGYCPVKEGWVVTDMGTNTPVALRESSRGVRNLGVLDIWQQMIHVDVARYERSAEAEDSTPAG